MEADLTQLAVRRDGGHVGAIGFSSPVGGGAWIQQPQPSRSGGVPRNVAVTEHEDVQVGKALSASAFTPLSRSCLMYHAKAQTSELCPGHLG